MLQTTLLLVLICLTSRMAAAAPADDQFDVAAGHYSKKLWKLAAEEFEVFLEKYPDHSRVPQSIFFLAEARLQTGATEEAEVRFREYLKREPEGKHAVAALFRAGETAYRLGRTAAAQTDLQRFVAEHPDDKLNAYALPYLGDLAMGDGKYEAAAAFFRDGLKRFPESPLLDDCRYGLARAQERLQQFDEAEKLYVEVASKADSALADKARFHLGALQFLRGQFDAALKTLQPVETELAASPWKSKAQLTQGWALMKLKRPDEAAARFGSAAEDPDLGVEAKYWLGLAQREKGQWQLAAETLAAAAELDPKHPLLAAIQYYAGDSLMQAGNLDGAAVRFDSVLAMGEDENPWRDDAACGKIRVALQTRNYESLDQEASAFHQRFPNSELRGQVDRMLARSLVEQRKFAEATKLLEPMIAAESDGTEA
ncbi:MAG: tetratricopeptide repeat protein, partial [Patescibacteria group bacterium]|nr:tetratricopeptide repeat protein [Patescibacteria group bacterium]